MAKIPVIRNGGSYGAVSVLYRTINDSASEGLDYVRPPGELRFADGQSEATLDVTIRNDPEMEYSEKFQVILQSTTGKKLQSYCLSFTKNILATINIQNESVYTLTNLGLIKMNCCI
jgi:hypothetical protein